VNNVVDSSATDAAKAEAVADIEAALAAGWSQGKVIYTIFSNLAAKDPADATWGATATLMANQVAVAKYYTEEQLGNATSVTALQSVISSVTASSDVSTDAAKAALITAGVDPVVVASQSFTLATSVDSVSGGAGDDVISGLLGTNGTYTVGDNIKGYSGSDTLNLITNGSAIAGGLVGINSVETINVRVLASAGEDVSLNAVDWSGVERITNASSLSSTVLTVSGLSTTTDIVLAGDTTINVGFSNTTTATAAVGVILNGAGYSTTGLSVLSGAAGTVDLDDANAGLISAVDIELSSGTSNKATIEAGANVKTYTISGAGNGIITTDDTITSFNAADASGTLDVTFNGTSNVVAVGGAGNDTFRFGSTYSNGDSIDGGAGTNTVTLTMGSFNRNLATTNVQSATVTYSETAGGTLNASGSTVSTINLAAGTANAALLGSIGSSVTVNVADTDIEDLTLDYQAGATNAVLNVGSAGGVVDIGQLVVTDAASMTINSVGSGGVIDGVSFDSDLGTLIVAVSGGEADLSMGSASAIALGGATTVELNTTGSASISFGSAVAGNSLSSFTVNAAGTEAGDVTVGTLSSTGITSLTLNAADGADISLGTLAVGNQATGASKEFTLAINVNAASSDVTLGAINSTGQGTLTVDLNQSFTADIVLGAISIGAVASGGATNFVLTDTAVIGGATAGIASLTMTSATGAQVTIGSISVASGGQFSAGAINLSDVANADVSGITINLGANADAFFGAITTTAGAVGAINIESLGKDASANFGNIIASSMGAISIDSSAATGYVDFGNITVSAGSLSGGIEVTGAVDGSDVTFGTVRASGAIGAVSVAGAGDFTLTLQGASVAGIESTQGVSGAFTINLDGVSASTNISVGRAVNSITTSEGGDNITLIAGSTSNDTIVITGITGTDRIENFGAGSAATAGGGDVIALSSGAWSFVGFLGGGITATAQDSFVLGSAISSTAGAISGSMIVLTTDLANIAAVTAFMAQLDSGSAAAAGDDILVLWSDGQGDTNVAIASFSATLAASGFNLVNVATIQGVTPGALLAVNFDIV